MVGSLSALMEMIIYIVCLQARLAQEHVGRECRRARAGATTAHRLLRGQRSLRMRVPPRRISLSPLLPVFLFSFVARIVLFHLLPLVLMKLALCGEC
jgi:hypothetical protein